MQGSVIHFHRLTQEMAPLITFCSLMDSIFLRDKIMVKLLHDHDVFACWSFASYISVCKLVLILWTSCAIAHTAGLTESIPSCLSSLVAILKRSKRYFHSGDFASLYHVARLTRPNASFGRQEVSLITTVPLQKPLLKKWRH